MAMVVRSNMMAMNANRQLGMNSSSVSKGLEKLSSGFKINRAGDDASGLAISEKMKAQIKGLEQASSNSQDGISLVQTAEGALTEVHSMLNRMTELATKSANGTIQDEVDREAIQSEVDALISEIDRIGDSTNFNGINLLDGSQSAKGGSSAVTAMKTDNLTLVDVAATTFTSKAGGSIGADLTAAGVNDGDSFQYSVTFEKDGKVQTKTFTLTKVVDKNDPTKSTLVGGSGKEYTAANAGDTDDIKAALLKEMQNDKAFNEAFSATTNPAGDLNLVARSAGSGGGKLVSTTETIIDGKTGAEKVNVGGNGAFYKNTVDATYTAIGRDAHKTVATGTMKVFDPTNANPVSQKDATITINGKKFLIAAKGADTTTVDKDITVITQGGNGAITADDLRNLAQAITQKTGLNVTNNAAVGLEFRPGAATSGGAGGGLTLQIGDTGDDFNMVRVNVDDMRSKNLGVAGLDVSSAEAARAAIQTVKDGINMVSTNRANLGAMQNRLEYTINNLDVTAENMNAANSRIRDTDMAKQMMDYTKMNVLTQSAQAMLAQANQQPQSILQLLQ